MQRIFYDLRLDASRMGSQAAVAVKRGDSRSRVLRVRLFAGSTPVTLGDGALAVLRGVKPDGHIFYNDCAVLGNVVEQAVTDQMMALPGAVACEMTVYDPDGQVLSTPCFDLYVEDLLIGDGAVESTDEYTALTEAMLRLANLEATVGENELDRETEEEERAGKEAEREAREDKREALYDEVKARYESGGFDGISGTVEIAETLTAEPGALAAFVERPDSTPLRRVYAATIPEGKRGETGDLRYATFGVDFETGELMMFRPDGYNGPDFALNEETCSLEVTVAGGAPTDIGRIVPMPAGDYSAQAAYPFLAVVYYEGDAYLSKGPTQGNPPTDAARWMRVTHVGEGTAIRLGEVTTGAPGTAAAIVNVGTEIDQVWDITLPRGHDGSGMGDMVKAVYDTNGSGAVDDAEALGGRPANEYALKTDVPADALRYDTQQTLTPAQQEAMRQKIGAGSGGFDGDYDSLTNKPIIPGAAEDIGAVPVGRKVNGKALNADITIDRDDVGLGSVDNTADLDKPIGTAMQAALDGKSDKDHTHGQYAAAADIPTVYEWARQPAKPSYSAAEVGALPTYGGAVMGTLAVSNPAVGTSGVRNIYAGTTDLVAGSSALPTGSIYLVYE